MTDKHDEINPEELRDELLDLAEVIRRLYENGELLESAPQLIKIFGNLRSQLFEYEVRHTGRLFGQQDDLPEVAEAQRIVNDAARQLEDEEDELWWHRFTAEPEEEEEC